MAKSIKFLAKILPAILWRNFAANLVLNLSLKFDWIFLGASRSPFYNHLGLWVAETLRLAQEYLRNKFIEFKRVVSKSFAQQRNILIQNNLTNRINEI